MQFLAPQVHGEGFEPGQYGLHHVAEGVAATRPVVVHEDHFAARLRNADRFRDGLAPDCFRLLVQEKEHDGLVEAARRERQGAGILVVVLDVALPGPGGVFLSLGARVVGLVFLVELTGDPQATDLALGLAPLDAVAEAKRYITQAIASAPQLGRGQSARGTGRVKRHSGKPVQARKKPKRPSFLTIGRPQVSHL